MAFSENEPYEDKCCENAGVTMKIRMLIQKLFHPIVPLSIQVSAKD